MDDLMEIMKPQLEGMQEMYRAGYLAGLEEGKRIALKALDKAMEKSA